MKVIHQNIISKLTKQNYEVNFIWIYNHINNKNQIVDNSANSIISSLQARQVQ